MTNADKFVSVYRAHLTRLRRENHKDYAWPLEDLPVVLDRMEAGIRRGSASKDGPAFRATCKELGIPHTYKAIYKFLDS